MPKVDCCGFPNRIGEIVVGGESLCLSLSREGATNLPRKTAHRPKKNSSGNSAKEVVWIIGKFRASTQKVKNGLRRSFEGWKTMAQATFRENSRANMPFFIENELLISQGLFFIFSLARTCWLQPGSLCSSDRVPKHSFFSAGSEILGSPGQTMKFGTWGGGWCYCECSVGDKWMFAVDFLCKRQPSTAAGRNFSFTLLQVGCFFIPGGHCEKKVGIRRKWMTFSTFCCRR